MPRFVGTVDPMRPHARGWPPLLVAGAGAWLVAVAGGVLTDVGPWYAALRKPSFQPPDWLFAPAWTLILALAAVAAAACWQAAPDAAARRRVVLLFMLTGLLNMLWSVCFFVLRRPDWALLELALLWLAVLALVVWGARASPRARWLLAPYLGWVGFAGVLNLAIVRLNPGPA